MAIRSAAHSKPNRRSTSPVDLDLELAVPEGTIEILFGARAFGYSLRQWHMTGGGLHCLVFTEIKN